MKVVDQFILAWFAAFCLIGVLFDSLLLLAGEGPISEATLSSLPHGTQVVNAWRRWIKIDPLMQVNPTWLMVEQMNIGSFAFYFIASVLIVKEDERVRAPALVWSGSMITMITIILYEEAFGPHQAPDFRLVLIAYSGYLLTPLVVIVRFWSSPAFEKRKSW